MLIIGKQKIDEKKYSSMSLYDMVKAITKNPKVFEGKSDIIIDKIKKAKNNGEDGWAEINKSWGIVASGKAKGKIDKYFKKGMEASKNYFSLPPEQSPSTRKIKIEQKKDTLDKVFVRKECSDELSNNSIKKATSIEGDAKNDVIIENMEPCEDVVVKLRNEVGGEKVSSFTNGLSIRKNQLNQLNSSEKEPKFQKILASHSIEEAIKAKVVFNDISGRSLNLIASKIKAKFDELKSSGKPELFEGEMLNAQELLKKYDNKLVCEKINKIIDKYLEESELYICENKSPISRIWYAINSVFRLQDITSHKFNEFKMAITDYLNNEPIESVEKCSSELMQEILNHTHENIANKVNNFIEVYSIDRVNELKGYANFSVESKPELLKPKKI